VIANKLSFGMMIQPSGKMKWKTINILFYLFYRVGNGGT